MALKKFIEVYLPLSSIHMWQTAGWSISPSPVLPCALRRPSAAVGLSSCVLNLSSLLARTSKGQSRCPLTIPVQCHLVLRLACQTRNGGN